MEHLVTTRAWVVKGEVADADLTWHRFVECCQKAGLSIFDLHNYHFPGGGMSGAVILGESHAAIHTWPERGCAWCELATCGDPAGLDRMESELGKVWTVKVANS